MSEKAPLCLKCVHNIGDGLCYRNNDGKGVTQLQDACSSREIFHDCDTCNKSFEKVKGKKYPNPSTCSRIKRVGIGICRGDWVINPYFDLASKGNKAITEGKTEC